jgi:ATP-binding cassette subfamily B protein
MMNGLYRHLRDRTHTLFRAYMMMVATFSTSIGLMSLGSVIALAIGATLLQLNAITIGTVYLIFRYTMLLVEPIEFLMLELINFQQATASINRIEELFGLQSERGDKGTTELSAGPLSVAFQDVTFRYNAEPPNPTLEKISFHLPPGAILGVVGRTGSGKSTLTRLIARLYDATTGRIEIDGTDVRQVAPPVVRQRIGLVTQDVQLFQATIRDNLTFFDDTIADDRILDALQNLGLWAWYCSLPKGLDSELASGGHGLSAGEAQLLAFTRVWLTDPGVVILDEATSRLDPFTESLIEQAVANLFGKGQRTGIIIAHRLTTLQRVDLVMILESGRIVEYGKRQHLAKDPNSRFYQLLHMSGDTSTTVSTRGNEVEI